MMPALALLLLAAVATAQPIIGPEIRSGVIQSLDSTIALANDGSGFAICWTALESGRSHVFFARLDASGQSTLIRELPTVYADANAYNPAVAANRESFVVTWTEVAVNQSTLWFTILDAAGQEVVSPQMLGSGSLAFPSANGSGFLVGAGSSIFTISAEGTITSVDQIAKSFSSSGPFEAFVGTPVNAGVSRGQAPLPCFGSGCPSPIPTVITVTMNVQDGCSVSQSWTLPVAVPMGSALGSDGKSLIYVFSEPTGHLRAMRLGPTHAATCAAVDPFGAQLIDIVPPDAFNWSAPQVAWDGTRFLTIYPGSYSELYGAEIRDGLVIPPFVIAEGARRPAVIAAGDGRFLVAYETSVVGGTQLVGRFIDFPKSRHRAVN